MVKLIPWEIFQQYINGKSIEEIAKENSCTVRRVNTAIRKAKLQA